MTREEEYDEIRILLDEPKANKPAAHQIVSGLFATEQRQTNRLGNTGRHWTIGTTQIQTVAQKSDYSIAAADFGKIFYAFRSLTDGSILPVPLSDMQTSVYAPDYDVWLATPKSGAGVSGDRIIVYRNADGTATLKITPTPTAVRTYSVVYAQGAVNSAAFADFEKSPALPNFARHRCLQTALFLLPRTEWNGYSRDENRQKRLDLQTAMQAEFAMEEREFDQYIRNPMNETVGHIGNWYE